MNPEKIPSELKERDQWCVFTVGPEKDANGRLVKTPLIAGSFGRNCASPTDPRDWRSLDVACRHREQHYAEGRPGECFVAYALVKKDGVVFLDIDDGTPDQDIQTLLLTFAGAYVEDSASGKGIHMLWKGNLHGSGRKRGKLELYDNARWVIMTGEAWVGCEVMGQADPFELKQLEDKFDKGTVSNTWKWEEIPNRPESEDDATVLCKCQQTHTNGKFQLLFYKGNWRELYGVNASQSEADFALSGMLAAASRNNEQVKRLFTQSALYRPDKSHKLFFALREHRARQIEQDKATLMFEEMAKSLAEQHRKETKEPVSKKNADIFTTIPDGLLKDIFHALMDNAYYPVRESCLATALVTCLAIFQRKYQTPTHLGLNMWIFLIGETAAGKDILKQGPRRLFAASKAPMEGIMGGPIAGTRGYVDSMRNNPRQCSYYAECAAVLKKWCSDSGPLQDTSLQKVLTASWTESTTVLAAPQRMLERGGGREKEVERPCLTIYGDSVPDDFYNAVGSSQVAGGFMPRFTVIEVIYGETEIPVDPGPQLPFPQKLKDAVYRAAEMTAKYDMSYADPVIVPWKDKVADKQFDKLRRELRIKQSTPECDPATKYKNQLASRSSEKILKLATLFAVCADWEHPAVTTEHVTWATQFVTLTDTRMINQLVSGDHDAAAHNQLKVMRSAIIRAMHLSPAQRAKNGYSMKPLIQGNPAMIPYGWLSTQCRAKGCFKDAKQGPATAVDNTLRELINRGELKEYSPEEKAKMECPAGRLFLNIGVSEEI